MNNFDVYWESMARKIGDAFSEGHLDDAELLMEELKREVRGKFGAVGDVDNAETYEGKVDYDYQVASGGDYVYDWEVDGNTVDSMFSYYDGSRVRVTIEKLKEN